MSSREYLTLPVAEHRVWRRYWCLIGFYLGFLVGGTLAWLLFR